MSNFQNWTTEAVEELQRKQLARRLDRPMDMPPPRKAAIEAKNAGKRNTGQMNKENSVFQSVCTGFNLPKPTPEYQFAKDAGRKWRIDWFFEANGRKVGLEVEGGVYTGGRHTRPTGFLGDMEKYNEMAVRGILLLRTTPDKLTAAKTLEMVFVALYGVQ